MMHSMQEPSKERPKQEKDVIENWWQQTCTQMYTYTHREKERRVMQCFVFVPEEKWVTMIKESKKLKRSL